MLRPLTDADAPVIAAWFEADPTLARRVFVAPPTPPVLVFGIERNGRLIGSVALHSASPDGQEIEIGVVMAPGERPGPGVEGVRRGCQLAFDSGVARVVVRCWRSNEAVWRMAQRAGFTPVQWTDDTVTLAMDRDTFDTRWRR